MSDKKEKKPQVAKPKYHSKGLRASGGAVASINLVNLEHGLLNTTKANVHTKKALALVRRYAAHA